MNNILRHLHYILRYDACELSNDHIVYPAERRRDLEKLDWEAEIKEHSQKGIEGKCHPGERARKKMSGYNPTDKPKGVHISNQARNGERIVERRKGQNAAMEHQCPRDAINREWLNAW